MIEIKKLQAYYQADMVFVTAHAAERFRQRGIQAKDIRQAVNNGEIIEQYPDDYPYPSCLIMGLSVKMQTIHVVMSDEGNCSRIITAYYPDKEKWEDDLKTRKV
ncbi:DUF4258 domain-containing protein [Selenomonas sp. FC4001]|uniref:DUF4258 domain-containing protein n=1 Tax=Selenomonas sp. FC4001 TaxID=1408313 RepID=UPI00056648E9|nr:DUF4258 domain-containing protein [Selenomonas sp. FC4001]